VTDIGGRRFFELAVGGCRSMRIVDVKPEGSTTDLVALLVGTARDLACVAAVVVMGVRHEAG